MPEETRAGDCATVAKRHVCGWSGPAWLHISGLCNTCKGSLPRLLDGPQQYGPRCTHPSCIKYRIRFTPPSNARGDR